MHMGTANAKTIKEFPGQHPGEEVVLVFRQHPVVLRRPLIYGLLAIVISILPLDFITDENLFSIFIKVTIAVFVLTLVYWFYHWLGWYYSVYILTDRRLIDIRQKGFFNRRVSEVGFEKIQSINYHIKGFQAAIMKFGDITVQTYTTQWILKNVHHPEEVHNQLMSVANSTTSTPPQI